MRIGIDLGGTTVTAALVSEEGKILTRRESLTHAQNGADSIVKTMAALALEAAGESPEPVTGVGVGTPGAVDVSGRVVVTSPNLPFRMYPLADLLEEACGMPVTLGNDANCALLGEVFAGAAKGCRDVILITLGTGIGGGIMVDGKLLVGFNGAAGEIGHMTMVYGGIPCNCGRKGCYEVYASTTALVRMAEEAAAAHPESLLRKAVDTETSGMTGRVLFSAAHAGDAAALDVLSRYEDAVAEGASSLVNIFEPELLLFGGGISAQGEYLIAPVRDRIYQRIYAADGLPRTRIEAATLGGDAGIVGAAALVK